MTTAVWITLIIVSGIVIVSLAGIGWLWWTTARGIGGISSIGRKRDKPSEKLEEIEKKLSELTREIENLKSRIP